VVWYGMPGMIIYSVTGATTSCILYTLQRFHLKEPVHLLICDSVAACYPIANLIDGPHCSSVVVS
jgi:hypothetical protein